MGTRRRLLGRLTTLHFILIAFLLSPVIGFAAETLQLTDDSGLSFLNTMPSVNTNGEVIWIRQDQSGAGHSDVLFYDELGTVSLTDNFSDLDYEFFSPQLNDFGQAVWYGNEVSGSSKENIFYYDGLNINEITQNLPWRSEDPLINNSGKVVWAGTMAVEGQSFLDSEIFYYDGIDLVQLTDGPLWSLEPTISDDFVVWTTANTEGGGDSDIYRYHDGVTERITNDSFSDVAPKVNDSGQVAWITASGPDAGIRFYDGTDITRLSDYSPSDPNIFLDINDQGQVVWNRNGDIFLFDGQQTLQLTDTPDREDREPYINASGEVTWISQPQEGVDTYIYRYDGTEVTRLDAEDFVNDRGARIADNGDVAWEGVRSNDQGSFDNQIFLSKADQSTEPPPPLSDFLPHELPITGYETPDWAFQPNSSSHAVNLTSTPLDPNKPSIILVHGTAQNPDEWPKEMSQKIESRLLEMNMADEYNIIAWDWRSEASFINYETQLINSDPYWAVALSTPVASICNEAGPCGFETFQGEASTQGKLLGAFLEQENLTDQLHLIGFSAGGTVVKEATNYLTNPERGYSVEHVTLLDSPNILLSSEPHNLTNTDWADNTQFNNEVQHRGKK